MIILKIKKRDLRIEEFSIDKIQTSISHAARDINYQITHADTKAISKKVFNTLTELGREESHTSSYEVKCIVLETLTDFNFNKIAKAFTNN